MTKAFFSLNTLDLSRAAFKKVPGWYITLFILPATGVLFIWTLKILKNMLILYLFSSPIPNSAGGDSKLIEHTVPSQGLTTKLLSNGTILFGFLKKNAQNNVRNKKIQAKVEEIKRNNSVAAASAPINLNPSL
jgi:hypothetical protein